MMVMMKSTRSALLATALLSIAACAGEGEGETQRVHVPSGASFNQVVDSLAVKNIVRAPRLFRIYGRIQGAAGSIRPGTYAFRENTGWDVVLDALLRGRVLTARMAVPEGWDINGIAPRIAEITGADVDSIRTMLLDTASASRFDVPGPNLEGYLYPATYTFPITVSVDTVVVQMVDAYRRIWTEERRTRAAERGMSEREVITLASIVEKEARVRDEMPLIASVFHNRLRIGMPLQADPTVQYAAGVHRARLLYAHIDSVADNPYNTYRHRGLPPGPIGSPSVLAVDATLDPADESYLYFVARPDGTHIFTRTLADHNRARAQSRREYEARAAQQEQQQQGQQRQSEQPSPSPPARQPGGS
jgi:UPF0755 protein